MPTKPRAVYLDFATAGPDIDTRALEETVDATYFPFSEPDEVAARIGDAEIAIVNKAKVRAAALAACPRLKLVAVQATGTDNVDLAEAKARGIAVANIREYCTQAVAQHVFALILGLTQRIAGYDALVRRGAWQASRSFALFDYPIRELAGRSLGIVGYGALGQAVGCVAECFGMRVIVSARPGAAASRASADGRMPFEEVLASVDVLTLHCPLTPETHHLIGARELERMRDDALLINTARGALVDGAALADALRHGVIGGAGIDVLPVEPPAAGDPLLAGDIPNLIVTPHVAWAAKEARQRALDQVTENIRDFLNGGRLRRVV